jgi:hypothetical protein
LDLVDDLSISPDMLPEIKTQVSASLSEPFAVRWPR